MFKTRLLFEKVGRASFISHLDLMRTLSRALVRSGLPVKHTEGFNPHIYLSVALPLSLGHESICELCDIVLLEELPYEEVENRLNHVLPEGIRVLKAYPQTTKVANIKYQKYRIVMPKMENIADFFNKNEVFVEKKTKKGMEIINLLDFIQKIEFNIDKDRTIIDTILSASPPLNPEYVVGAVSKDLPCDFIRLELYDENLQIFR